MPITGRYVDEIDCQDALSAEVWQRILDDNADGAADASPGQRIVNNAESFAEGRIKAVYSLAVLRAQGRASVANELKRIVLDLVVAFAMRRHPAYIRGDWPAMLREARIDLKELREQLAELDTLGVPEPAANTGGLVESGDAEEPDPVEATFLGPGRMGIF